MSEMTKYTLLTLFAVVFIYSAVASIVFEFRNPLANRTVLITHILKVWTFQRVPAFQPKEEHER